MREGRVKLLPYYEVRLTVKMARDEITEPPPVRKIREEFGQND